MVWGSFETVLLCRRGGHCRGPRGSHQPTSAWSDLPSWERRVASAIPCITLLKMSSQRERCAPESDRRRDPFGYFFRVSMGQVVGVKRIRWRLAVSTGTSRQGDPRSSLGSGDGPRGQDRCGTSDAAARRECQVPSWSLRRCVAQAR